MKDPSTNFGEAAKRYQAFRPAYPPEVFDFLIRHVGSRRERAVDLGAGSGQATQTLARFFTHVVAIEPDSRLAGQAQWPENVEMDVRPAETARFSEASVDAVIAATAFHWMDQPLICRNAARWLKPGGAFFPFAFDLPHVDGPAGDFYDSEFEKWKAYRDRRLIERYDYERALKESAVFANVVRYEQSFRHTLPPETAAGLISTFSFVRDYARVQGDAEKYFESVKDAFLGFGETISFVAPVIGALGVKG